MSDIVIVGAGCAGLSLAYHLLERGVDRPIVLVDPRKTYGHDRTWCGFRGAPHPFEDLASHRWSRWRVRAERWIERSAAGLTYEHIPADAFYRRCLDRLRRGPVELRLGVRAGALRQNAGGVALETDAGPVRGRIAFDSRPTEPSKRGDITLLQHFEGWHVRTDRDAFDPGVATLMDFAVPQEHAIHFFYVLPYSEREALVEATYFGGAVLDEAGYRVALERYLRNELGLGNWTVVRRERGVIPMSTADTPPSEGRVHRIGLAGGMAKPSTGYAFQAIQRFSAEMAARLAEDALPAPPAPRAWRARALDAIFLSYLDRYPARAPRTFATLFERVEPALLARFLGDDASPIECLRVMRALPFAPFTLETARSRRLWMR